MYVVLIFNFTHLKSVLLIFTSSKTIQIFPSFNFLKVASTNSHSLHVSNQHHLEKVVFNIAHHRRFQPILNHKMFQFWKLNTSDWKSLYIHPINTPSDYFQTLKILAGAEHLD